MSEYIHLLGAEDVQRAGSAMRGAATDIQRAVSSLDDILFRYQRFMDDWLDRFENKMKGGE